MVPQHARVLSGISNISTMMILLIMLSRIVLFDLMAKNTLRYITVKTYHSNLTRPFAQ